MGTIPKKNYLLLMALTILTILLVLYANQWIKSYKFNKSNISPLVTNISQINKKELHLSLAESNQIILYVSYTGNNKIKRFENDLLKKIKSKNLNDYVIYYDITNELKNDEYLNILRTEFVQLKTKINKAPMLFYVKNGVAIEVADSNEELITMDEFEYLINKYKVGE